MSAYPVITLRPDDGVVVARGAIEPGTPVADGVAAAERIPAGHKVAVRPHRSGEAVTKYGQIIGFAKEDIAAGRHVHVHNLGMGEFARDYAFGVDARPTRLVTPPATFQGIRRPDGDRKSTRLNSSHSGESRMPSSA